MRSVLVGIFFIFIVGCNSSSKQANQLGNRSDLIASQYKKVKESLNPSSLFSHFPVSVDCPFILKTITDDMAMSYSYKLYNYNCEVDSLKQLSATLVKTAIKIYNSTDSISLVMKESFNYKEIKERIIRGEIPTPFFEEQDVTLIDNFNLSNLFQNTPSGLNPNFKIYIVDNQSIYNSSNLDVFKLLPRTHNKAYSRGVSINIEDRCVVYWTIFF